MHAIYTDCFTGDARFDPTREKTDRSSLSTRAASAPLSSNLLLLLLVLGCLFFRFRVQSPSDSRFFAAAFPPPLLGQVRLCISTFVDLFLTLHRSASPASLLDCPFPQPLLHLRKLISILSTTLGRPRTDSGNRHTNFVFLPVACALIEHVSFDALPL